MTELNWWTGATADEVQHEVGHMLGLFAEYPEGATDPASDEYHNVSCSLMHYSECSTMYPRYYDRPYAQWLKSKTNRTFQIVE